MFNDTWNLNVSCLHRKKLTNHKWLNNSQNITLFLEKKFIFKHFKKKSDRDHMVQRQLHYLQINWKRA